jgi:hypothetical protein
MNSRMSETNFSTTLLTLLKLTRRTFGTSNTIIISIEKPRALKQYYNIGQMKTRIYKHTLGLQHFLLCESCVAMCKFS